MPAETVSQDHLVAYLREVGPQTLPDIALIAGISEATVRRNLDGAAAQGLVTVQPGARGIYGQPRVYGPASEITADGQADPGTLGDRPPTTKILHGAQR